MLGKVFIVIALLAVGHFMGLGEWIGIGSGSEEPDLSGALFVQDGPPAFKKNGDPVSFGFRFLDGDRVDMLANDKLAGHTMDYEVEGNQILLTHTDGSHMELKLVGDGRIHQPNRDWYFSRQ